MEQITQWWNGLDARDKRILTVGGIFLIGAIYYMALWKTGTSRITSAQVGITANQKSLSEMQEIAAKINSSKAKPTAAAGLKDRNNQSLFSLADATAKRTKLKNTPIDVKPDGDDKVRVNLNSAEFDALITWLGMLKADYGIVVDSMTIKSQELSGFVSARLVLIDTTK